MPEIAAPSRAVSSLVHEGEGSADTVIGIECHIVAKRDHPSVARAPSALTRQERDRHAQLTEHRHGLSTLVLMCPTHSRMIDAPEQGYSIEHILALKHAHERTVAAERAAQRAAGLVRAKAVTHLKVFLRFTQLSSSSMMCLSGSVSQSAHSSRRARMSTDG